MSALGVSRSNLYQRINSRQLGRSARYSKSEDALLLPMIEALCDKRETSGYRRITAHLNRQLKTDGHAISRVNPKRVYRIMRLNNLLLAKHISRVGEHRAHEGKVITLHSNTRWCSDGFEIKCWNKEKVRVAFSLDCCDREIISYVATTAGISGTMVQDILVESIEKRFGDTQRLPQEIEWLTDNGSCYIAEETRKFAKTLGFKVCTTPVRSPESNGMAEAFVKTFKRDYVYLSERPNAATVMAQLAGWFEDYNSFHPHSGLKMMSPREYRALKMAS